VAKIESLINKRKQQYDALTKTIMQTASDTTETVCDFLVSKLDEEITSVNNADLAYLKWDTISGDDDQVFFSGHLYFRVGVKIPFEDDTIIVTDENKEYFRYVVRLTIPTNLVNQKDKAAITEFLRDFHLIQPDDELGMLNPESDEGTKVPLESSPNTSGFNIDDLTPEQQEALRTLQHYDTTGVKN